MVVSGCGFSLKLDEPTTGSGLLDRHAKVQLLSVTHLAKSASKRGAKVTR